MSENHDNLVNKEVCKEKHETVGKNFAEMKANIYTSKESLGNRLDTVGAELRKAMLGNENNPGGVLRDIIEIKRDMKRLQATNTEHEKRINEKVGTQNFRIKLCVGMVVILLGGKFFGFSLEGVKEFFTLKPPTPIVASSPVIEDDNVPQEMQELIKQILIDQKDEHEDGTLDIEKEKTRFIPTGFLEKEIHKDEHRDMSLTTVNKIIPLEENK